MSSGIILTSIIALVLILCVLKTTYDTKKSTKEFKVEMVNRYLENCLNKIFKDFETLVSQLEKEQETGDEPRYGYIYLYLADYIKTDILPRQAFMGDYIRNNSLLSVLIDCMVMLKLKIKNSQMDNCNPSIVSSMFTIEDNLNNTYRTVEEVMRS